MSLRNKLRTFEQAADADFWRLARQSFDALRTEIRKRRVRELVEWFDGPEEFAERFRDVELRWRMSVDRVRQLMAGAWPTAAEVVVLMQAEIERDKESGCASDPLILRLRSLTVDGRPCEFKSRDEAVKAFAKIVADAQRELGLPVEDSERVE